METHPGPDLKRKFEESQKGDLGKEIEIEKDPEEKEIELDQAKWVKIAEDNIANTQKESYGKPSYGCIEIDSEGEVIEEEEDGENSQAAHEFKSNEEVIEEFDE